MDEPTKYFNLQFEGPSQLFIESSFYCCRLFCKVPIENVSKVAMGKVSPNFLCLVQFRELSLLAVLCAQSLLRTPSLPPVLLFRCALLGINRKNSDLHVYTHAKEQENLVITDYLPRVFASFECTTAGGGVKGRRKMLVFHLS